MQIIAMTRTTLFSLDCPTRHDPKLIGQLAFRHRLPGEQPEGVRLRAISILPASIFFPFPYEATFTPDCIRENTLAIHHWERSWSGSIPLPLRIASGAKRRIEALVKPRHV